MFGGADLTEWVLPGGGGVGGSYSIYVNSELFEHNQTPNITFKLTTNSVTVDGQLCTLFVTTDPKKFFYCSAVIVGLIIYLVANLVKYYGTFAGTPSSVLFGIQNMTYGEVLLTAYVTFARYDYCYGYDSVYVNASGDLSSTFEWPFWIAFVLIVLSILLAVGGLCCDFMVKCFDTGDYYSSSEDRSKGFVPGIVGTVGVVTVMGIVFRVITFPQGFESFLPKLYLLGDVLFHSHLL